MLPLGPACSRLLLVFIVLRGAICFLPCQQWGPSGYWCSAPYLGLRLGAPHTSVADAAIPEGVQISNRLSFLTFRREVFTVDESGYRNGPGNIAVHPEAVLFGSSFSLGLALSDEQTLTARWNQELGPVVYNAATTFRTVLRPAEMIRVARSRHMNRGWIIVEALNRDNYVFAAESGALARFGLRESPVGALRTALAPEYSLIRRVAHPYAEMRMSVLLNLRIEDDRFLPNPFRGEYPEETLITGRHILVFSGDKRFAQNPGPPAQTAEALIELRDALIQDGYRLAVLLLPTGYSVYYPLLRDPSAPDASQSYMAAITDRLALAKVPVLNLLPPLREEARRALTAEGRLIYYPDDAHWNPRGCQFAAQVAAPWLRSLLKQSAEAGRELAVPRRRHAL